MKLNREQLDERMLDYLYDDLDDAARAAFERDVVEHPGLVEEVAAHQRIRDAASQLPSFEMPAGLLNGVLDVARERTEGVSGAGRQSWFARWLAQIAELAMRPGVAAAMVALMVTGVGVFMVERVNLELDPSLDQGLPAASAPSRADGHGVGHLVGHTAEQVRLDGLMEKSDGAVANGAPGFAVAAGEPSLDSVEPLVASGVGDASDKREAEAPDFKANADAEGKAEAEGISDSLVGGGGTKGRFDETLARRPAPEKSSPEKPRVKEARPAALLGSVGTAGGAAAGESASGGLGLESEEDRRTGDYSRDTKREGKDKTAGARHAGAGPGSRAVSDGGGGAGGAAMGRASGASGATEKKGGVSSPAVTAAAAATRSGKSSSRRPARSSNETAREQKSASTGDATRDTLSDAPAAPKREAPADAAEPHLQANKRPTSETDAGRASVARKESDDDDEEVEVEAAPRRPPASKSKPAPAPTSAPTSAPAPAAERSSTTSTQADRDSEDEDRGAIAPESVRNIRREHITPELSAKIVKLWRDYKEHVAAARYVKAGKILDALDKLEGQQAAVKRERRALVAAVNKAAADKAAADKLADDKAAADKAKQRTGQATPADSGGE